MGRLARHLGLAVASGVAMAALARLLAGGTPEFRLSMAAAYTSFALLGVALAIGPWQVLRRRPNPLSSDLRRDVGIWAGVTGLLHGWFGLHVHSPGAPEQYFLWAPGEQGVLGPLRYDLFGLTNWAGLGAVVLVIALLALSNDLAVRRLGPARWKALQRLTYVLFGLVVGHAAVYQILERRATPWVVAFVATTAVVTGVQLTGWHRRRPPRAAPPPRRAAP